MPSPVPAFGDRFHERANVAPREIPNGPILPLRQDIDVQDALLFVTTPVANVNVLAHVLLCTCADGVDRVSADDRVTQHRADIFADLQLCAVITSRTAAIDDGDRQPQVVRESHEAESRVDHQR